MMRSSLFVTLWMAVSMTMTYASPLSFGSLFSGLTTTATKTATITNLRTDLLSIIDQVECYMGITITTPPILVTTSVSSLISGTLSRLSSIFSSILGAPAKTCKPTSSSAAAASLVSLRAEATPKWTSLVSLLQTSASMPYYFSATTSTPAKTTTTPIIKTTATQAPVTTAISKTSSSAPLAPSISSTIKQATTLTASTLPASLSSTIKLVSTPPSSIIPTSLSSTIKLVSTPPSSNIPTSSSSTVKGAAASSVTSGSTSLVSSTTAATISSISSSTLVPSSTLVSNSTLVSSSQISSTSSAASAVGTPCAGNTAADRSKWCDYSISSDYYTEVPNTGVTREYWLDVAAATIAPDGFSRYAQLVNNSLPGPTIFADWGDTVVVHLSNSIPNNGSSFHFHGIHQKNTNQQDGVPSITQCPVAPGETYTYTWRATQYGTSWYHSHFSLQAWQGVAGGIVINGPATANYDEEKGILFLSDWGHQTVDEQWHYASTVGAPTLQNSLINGTNVYGDDGAANQTGSRFETSVTAGKSYRFRLVNGAIDTHYKFSIDNHTFTVIAMDFVPITPYQTTILDIAIGQRYDIIVTADQGAIGSDFWMRTTPQMACSTIENHSNIKGILHYGSSTGTPATTGYAYTDACVDEASTKLVPYLSKNVGTNFYSTDQSVTVGLNAENLFKWYLNSTTFLSDWADPTVLQVSNNITTFEAQDAVIQLPEASKWMHMVVQTKMPVPHPIHLHGHDFFVLAEGSTAYDASTVSLNMANPPRRDVATLQASGYLVLAWETDNPGAWLMHCHIGWHTSAGFALQFVERYSEIPALLETTSLQNTCDAWSSYAAKDSVKQEDSGV